MRDISLHTDTNTQTDSILRHAFVLNSVRNNFHLQRFVCCECLQRARGQFLVPHAHTFTRGGLRGLFWSICPKRWYRWDRKLCCLGWYKVAEVKRGDVQGSVAWTIFKPPQTKQTNRPHWRLTPEWGGGFNIVRQLMGNLGYCRHRPIWCALSLSELGSEPDDMRSKCPK